MAILGPTGGRIPKRKPQTQNDLNATPKTTGNAVTGTRRYTTPYSSPNLYPDHHAPTMKQVTREAKASTRIKKSNMKTATGKWAQGAVGKWKQGAVGRWKKGGSEEKADEEKAISGSAETGTTGFAHQYSKSPYRTSQFAMGPGRMEFGKSGTGKKKSAEKAPTPQKPRRPKPKKK